jgi:predicted phosphoribosyltransferase
VPGPRGRTPPFEDRDDAGRQLAAAVQSLLGSGDWPAPIVLGMPRGGVPPAAAVAARLGAPLDVAVVRKLGHPRRRELGVGAIAEDGVRVLNQRLIRRLGVTEEALDAVDAAERAELERRARLYRRGRPRPELAGRTAVLVDDGLATGYTALAAIESARRRGAGRTVLAVPVGSPEALDLLRTAADAVICLLVPPGFEAVGQAYRCFDQVPDEAVLAALGAPPPGAPD